MYKIYANDKIIVSLKLYITSCFYACLKLICIKLNLLGMKHGYHYIKINMIY